MKLKPRTPGDIWLKLWMKSLASPLSLDHFILCCSPNRVVTQNRVEPFRELATETELYLVN